MPVTDFGVRLVAFDSPTYRGLREAQTHVLTVYASDHLASPDVAVELPTGTGKTLVGLLIADWALDQGMAVAYLTGTNQLADQVAAQAVDLGERLGIARFWGGHYPGGDLQAYHGAQAMGLMNYWVYFNSRPVVKPADLVIFDDAHIAEQPLSGLVTLRISRARSADLYEQICGTVIAHTGNIYESLPAMRDGAATGSTPPELLAFNDWAAVTPQVRDLISQSRFAGDDDVRFVWQELRGRLDRCGVLVGPSAIEIRPYHPPTQTLPSYGQATQRVYLSATLGTPDDLQRRLGIKKPISIITPPEMAQAQTGRRRLFLNPTQGSYDSPATWEFVMGAAKRLGRVAWLCSSNTEADEIESNLIQSGVKPHRLRGGDDAELESWRAGAEGHLVTAGRFDGFDFRGEVCRLVVIPSIPAASTEFERFAVAYLGDATFMRHRVGQRVTQALGRANRDSADWAIYLGLDPSFGSVLADPAVAAAISDDVKATVSAALEGHGRGTWAEVMQAIEEFVEGAQPVAPSPALRPGRRPISTASGSGTAHFEVEAIAALWLGDWARAASLADEASRGLYEIGEAEHSAFWQYVRAHALWGSGRSQDLEAAKAAIRGAVDGAPNTSWFIRLRRTLDELDQAAPVSTGLDGLFLGWEEWIREQGSSLRQEVARGRADLDGTHDQQCNALLTMGYLCGAAADRPSGSSATDCRWRWVNDRRGERRVWEVKTGGDAITRSNVNQLLGQVSAEEKLSPKSRVIGCLLTPHVELEPDAALAATSVAVLQSEAVVRWYEFLADRFLDYLSRRGSGTAVERGEARTVVESRLPKGGWLERLLAPTNGHVREQREVDQEFASTGAPG